VFFCPHTADDHCECRKPKPGMIREIIERFEANPAHTPMVGDALRDLQAGAAFGLPANLVLTGKGRATLAKGGLPEGTRVYDDLLQFAFDFLGREAD
jgi:D-glycero-D-manno-heptose 1,7-bisphosphate phosphatase